MPENETKPNADAGPVDCKVKPQLRLYVVRVLREAYVLAESESEAEAMRSEIDHWEEPVVEVSSGREMLEEWSPPERCFVYHRGGGDITLAAARAGFPAA